MKESYKLGWFSTGRGPGSLGMLKAVQESILAGEINAEIEFVYCTRERGETEATDYFLDTVESYGIPLVSFSYRKFRDGRPSPDLSKPLPQWRLDYDAEVIRRLGDFHPDLCVLAGFMIVTGPEMCAKYEILNLHPAAPGGPAGTWQQVIWKLIESRASVQGIKMHVAIPELDMGPTATYCTFSIDKGIFEPLWREFTDSNVAQVKAEQGENNALFRTIRENGAKREMPLIIATIRAFSEGKLRITKDRQVVDAAGLGIQGYDLTAEIDRMVEPQR